MNIAFLSYTQNYGGAQRSTLELASSLMKRGYNVKVIDVYGFINDYIDDIKKYNLEYNIIDSSSKAFILYDSNILKRFFNIIKYFPVWISQRRKLDKSLIDFDPDIVFVSGVKTLSLLKNRKEYKIAFFAQGWYKSDQISFKSRSLFRYYKVKFIAVSEATRHALYVSKIAKLEDIYVVPNSINEDQLEVQRHEKDLNSGFNILHAGGFLKSKGHHISLEIANKLKKNNVDFKLTLAGFLYKSEKSMRYYESLKEYIKQNNLEERVEFIVNNNNIKKYYHNCNVLIHPSETEGMPRVVMEAMILGKPVIANPVGGVIDYIIHGYSGFLPRYNNVDDYVEYLLLLMRDKDVYELIANNQKSIMETSYNEEEKIRRIVNFLKDIGV
jgi:glycosyltransferase involved in cell wall biosynthesis